MLAVPELFFVITISIVTALIARFLLTAPQRPTPTSSVVTSQDPLSFLFDEGVLHHANSAALKRFTFAPGTHVWDDLRDRVLRRFPNFPEQPGTDGTGSIRLRSEQANDSSEIEMNWRDGLCWVHLNEPAGNNTVTGVSPRKDGPLERCVKTMLQLAWETDKDGQIVWKNDAYSQLEARLGTQQDGTVFALDSAKEVQRCSAVSALNGQEWFEVVRHSAEDWCVYNATPMTALIKAEEAQRSFVQTLAKTFAHLPIGLAIFDRHGQLGIFNPALVDLTGLQASYFATQPRMQGFFDALRENRRMPEPKNYRTWRQDIADVIAAASGGQYHETWTLEDGRTYAVQGRPHPDGATAFLIEDISAQVTLSRSFRAEIEQFEALLDNVDDALAVFSCTGVLTFCNDAYRKMWGQNPEAAFADVTFHDAVRLWDSKVRVGTDWSGLTSFAATLGPRSRQTFDIYLSQGGKLRCAISPLSADATMIRFCATPDPEISVTPGASTTV